MWMSQVRALPDQPSGYSSAWLERLVWDQEVACSNRVAPTIIFTILTMSV
jgi:hypothetical protein